MPDKNTVLDCFQMALEANGERMAGQFERELLVAFLKRYPQFKIDLRAFALTWAYADRVADPDNWNHIAEHRIETICDTKE